MKIALLLAFVAVASAMQIEKYIPGQYLIRVDEAKFQTKAELMAFSETLEKKFKIYSVKNFDFGSVKFLYVKGEHQNVMKAEALAEVKYVQHNMVHGIAQSECVSGSANGAWGLDRTDQRDALPYSDPTSSEATYISGDFTGSSTLAYVADTGIDIEHPEFSGRAVWGYTAGDIPTDGDGNGHGTHCAGTIGSNSYGLAKHVQLSAVKVLRDSGFGSTDGIIDGLNWIQADHESRSGSGNAKSVINMSLGGGADTAFDEAIAACVAAGVTVVAAAGNSNADACNSSPAREPTAVTVGATNVNDASAYFTNWGTCLDILAPGVDVLSTVPNEGTDVFSGTSMAAPHVVGVVARYMDSLADGPLPADVDAWLKSEGTVDVISWYNDNHGTSPNLLLYGEC